MTLDYKKPDFSAMPDFMRKQVRFSSLDNANPNLAKALFEKTVHDAKTRFYNYAALTGELEKSRNDLNQRNLSMYPLRLEKKKRRTLKQKKEELLEELPEQNDVKKWNKLQKKKGKITEKI